MAFTCFARHFRTKRCLMFFIVFSSYIGCLSSEISVPAHINGFRIQSYSEEKAAPDPSGRVSIVGNLDVTIRVFTVVALPTSAQISFTKVGALTGTACDNLRSTEIFDVTLEGAPGDSSGLSVINLPSDKAIYMFCLRLDSNSSSSTWVHQGNVTWLQLAVTGPASPKGNLLTTWASIIIIALLIAVSAMCTTLGVETLSLSRSELKLFRSCGVSAERRYAKAVIPLRKRGNRVLCSLLFCGIFANACIAVLIEDMLQLPGAAMVISAALIIMLATLVPLIIGSKVGLLLAAKSSWLVNVFVAITLPFSYSFGRLMDWLLANDLPNVCDPNRIQCLQQSNQPSMGAKEEDKDEPKASSSKSLGLSTKCVKDLMISIEEVFMVEYNGVLDEKALQNILASGFTRIPVYENDLTNVVALLHVRDLAYIRASDRTSLRTLCKFYNHPVNFVFEDTSVEVMLEEFKKGVSRTLGQSHMAFVQRVNCEGTGDPFYETLGMITLEDVIESIFQSEVIIDPPDIIRDNAHLAVNAKRLDCDFALLCKRSTKELSSQMETAVCQFLSTLAPFSEPLMSQKIIGRMLKQDVVVDISPDKMAESSFLYQRGHPSDMFILIIEGHVKIHVGNEDFIFEGGPFMYFGLQVLLDMIQPTAANETASHGEASGSCPFSFGISSKPYIPDYTVEAAGPLRIVRISVAEYKTALRAAALEYRIHEDETSSSHDIYGLVAEGNVAIDMGYTMNDVQSPVKVKSNSQLLNHHEADA